MKKILLGIGAVGAAAYAAKKMIDKEMEKEYIENLEKEWEEEANFNTPVEEVELNETEEELERVFAESENKDMTEGLFSSLKSVVKKTINSLPRVTVTINVEDRKNEEE